jgi:hypothetical protein
MRSVTDCKHRADECHKLANLAARPEDWGHFLEMAQTWEILLKQRQHENQLAETVALAQSNANENQLAETLALAQSIANGRRPKLESGMAHTHKKAA